MRWFIGRRFRAVVCVRQREVGYDGLMSQAPKITKPHSPVARAAIEVAFIVFLFYSNLLMGEFTAGNQHGKTLMMAVRDMVTWKNFVIANVSAFVGYVGFEWLRKRS